MIYKKISSNLQTSSCTGKIVYMQSKQLSIRVERAQKHLRVSGRWGNWEWQHKAMATNTGGSVGGQMKSLGLTVETHVENLPLQEAKTRVRQEQTFRALLHTVTRSRTRIPFPSKLFFSNPSSNPTIPACVAQPEIQFPFFNYFFQPLKKAKPSSHFTPSGPSVRFTRLRFACGCFLHTPICLRLVPLGFACGFVCLRTVKEPSSETLLRLAELVLTLNCFSFAGSYYKQINGVAMGTKMGPSYANLFVGYIEHKFFNQYNGPKPELYRRYIDDCVGATSSTREELNQFITAVNSFHPALKYTWEISDSSLAFLDIKLSIEGNGLCTSVHYKPTDSHSYLLYSSSHPSHVKNSIPYSQLLRLRRLCSEDSDFSLKSEEMCHFFDKRGYPASVVQAGHHRAQQIDRQSALQMSQKENNNRIPFTLTFHPHNHAVKSIILKNFKLLQNDPDTGVIFSQPPLISFKRDKNIGNFLVRSAFQTSNQAGTFKCARARCKTCPFICNVEKLSGPKRSIKITDHFTCTSTNVIYCITCTLCKKLYIGETGRRLGDRFREHLRDVEKDDKNASKPVARHFNLPNHSKQHMVVCGLSLHQGSTESRKTQEQKFIFQIGTLNPHGINERFSFN